MPIRFCIYDLEYFQRFEPVSVDEMLKRVPGVTFTSDVLEYDGHNVAEVLANRAAGEVDKYELERKRSGRLFRVTLRAAF